MNQQTFFLGTIDPPLGPKKLRFFQGWHPPKNHDEAIIHLYISQRKFGYMGCKQKDLLIILRKIDLIKSIERPPKSPPKPHKGFCPMACFVFFPDPGKILTNQAMRISGQCVCPQISNSMDFRLKF